ncbi:MAG TPA: ABC transporter substrate binding protein [Acidisoma sp.]|uniref:ABC transporter substrate binding protein n=1 Tax=Acidisoma sp. TaxID=1872115 RepID=UPI002BB4CC00|nr:ABC transporter substrate binding protein [Acidisoma sp.]HTI01478.1 ABC transporter substrate binding protein [Acidisoma sp.]
MALTRRGFSSSALGLIGLASLGGVTGARAAEPITIGLSNGYFGTEWRDQMIDASKKQFAMYEANGLAGKLIVQQAGPDTAAQIQDVRNMIRSRVKVIMIDANSATALTGVIHEAKRAKIPVIAFDQAVSDPYAINVGIDEYDWGKHYAEWIVQQLNGKGRVAVMDGVPGHPAAVARRTAFMDVFAKNKGIDIVWSGYGMWDQAKAQAVMATVLAATPHIDAVCTEDGMGLGIMRAFQAAGRPVPIMTGEAQKSFLLAWKKERDAGHDVHLFARSNPPEIGRTAVGVATRIAQGKQLKPLPDNTYHYPIKIEVTNDNLDELLEGVKDKPDGYFLGEWLDEKQLDALFA